MSKLSKEELQEFAEMVSPFAKKVSLRGIE